MRGGYTKERMTVSLLRVALSRPLLPRLRSLLRAHWCARLRKMRVDRGAMAGKESTVREAMRLWRPPASRVLRASFA